MGGGCHLPLLIGNPRILVSSFKDCRLHSLRSLVLWNSRAKPKSDTSWFHVIIDHSLTQYQAQAPVTNQETRELISARKTSYTDDKKHTHGWRKIISNWTTTKQKLFSFPFCLPWNLLPFLSLTRLLLALPASPSLILPGTLDSFLTQNCPWRSTS